MNLGPEPDRRRGSFGAALGTAAGYALVLVVMTALLFGLPLLAFSLL